MTKLLEENMWWSIIVFLFLFADQIKKKLRQDLGTSWVRSLKSTRPVDSNTGRAAHEAIGTDNPLHFLLYTLFVESALMFILFLSL